MIRQFLKKVFAITRCPLLYSMSVIDRFDCTCHAELLNIIWAWISRHPTALCAIKTCLNYHPGSSDKH